MSMSRKTICGPRRRGARSSASSPSPASVSRKPETSSSVVAISCRMRGSSSTMRIVRLISDAVAERARTPRRGSARRRRRPPGRTACRSPRGSPSRARCEARRRGGTGGRSSARRARRRPRTRAPRAGSPRPPARPGSPCRPSARGGGGRRASPSPRKSTSRRISEPITGCRTISAYSSSVSAPGLKRIASGDARPCRRRAAGSRTRSAASRRRRCPRRGASRRP